LHACRSTLEDPLERGEKIGDYKREEVTPQHVMDLIAAAAGVK
jgi:hypothetical protein